MVWCLVKDSVRLRRGDDVERSFQNTPHTRLRYEHKHTHKELELQLQPKAKLVGAAPRALRFKAPGVQKGNECAIESGLMGEGWCCDFGVCSPNHTQTL